jgi:hypothetical protein
MGRKARACAGIVIVIAGVLSVSANTAATSAVRCEEKVLTDWSDNGRVDGIYPLHCYQAAIETMPADLRDYTNATEAIQRALTRAETSRSAKSHETSRVAAGAGPQVGAAASSNVPLPLVALAAISLTVLAAGGVGYLARRRRTQREA